MMSAPILIIKRLRTFIRKLFGSYTPKTPRNLGFYRMTVCINNVLLLPVVMIIYDNNVYNSVW